jgi:Cu-Zn family superoxide dismutase
VRTPHAHVSPSEPAATNLGDPTTFLGSPTGNIVAGTADPVGSAAPGSPARRRRSAAALTGVAAISAGLVLFAASPSIAGADRVRSEQVLSPYAAAAGGDPSLVPAGATARVQAVYNAAGDSIVTLHVTGLLPDRTYGAHAHLKPCGLTGAAAGPHYQFAVDPAPGTSVDPKFANPRNEIWLDVHTDENGDGAAQTRVPWQFAPDRRPGSVMIHASRTATGVRGDGVAGAAGTRLACVDVGF